MKLKKWIKIITIAGCVMTLAACSSGRKPQDPNAINDANASYSDASDAQTSGAGDDAQFGDKSGRIADKKVYYFDYDSNIVHDSDRPAILSNAKKLSSRHSTKVLLEGHTDPRGSREYNIGLGERRAKAVAAILAENGVDPSQVRIVSYGAEKLAAPGRTEEDYQMDRRVVLVYLR